MNERGDVANALARLRAAADAVRQGWVPQAWKQVRAGQDAETINVIAVDGPLQPYGQFANLTLLPGTETHLQLRLELPEQIHGVGLGRDRLELTVFAAFPTSYRLNGVSILEDEVPTVALGPALLTVLPEIVVGDNGLLEAVIRTPANQITPAFNWIHFTTPRLRARFETLDLAWAQLFLASSFAEGPGDGAAVAAAAALVPVDLAGSAEESLAHELAQMAAALAPLQERVAAVNMHLVGHSHIDMNWLWTWPDTVEVIRRDFRSILAMMRDYPEMKFTHSQPATYRVIQELEPGMFATVREHIAAGRWEAATFQWVEGDTNMASGEATVRQALEAVSYSREELGVSPRAFLAPDTFGHSGTMPQVAVSAGARVYYHGRCNPGYRADGRLWPAYWWEGIDGSRLLAVGTLGWYAGHITAGDIARVAVDSGHASGLPAGLMFYGVGDHGGGPTRHSLDTLRRLQQAPGMPRMACSTLDGFAEEIINSGVRLPVHRGESHTIFEGCYTTHADTKRYNRHGENALQTADALAALTGSRPGADLSEAWRKVLFNQFHDILDGSAIHEAYIKNGDDFAEASEAAARATAESLAKLSTGTPTGSVAVTNPLGWDRTDAVLVGDDVVQGDWLTSEAGVPTPVQRTDEGACFVARVGALATARYAPTPAPPAANLSLLEVAAHPTGDLESSTYVRVDTGAYGALVRRDSGIIVSFRDKASGRELVGFGTGRATDVPDSARPDLALNVLQLVEENHHPMASWHFDEVRAEHNLIGGATTRVLETGPVRAVLEVTHRVRASTIRQRITFYAELPRIDFVTDVDWQEPGAPEIGIPNLKVAFTVDGLDGEAWYEAPYGAARRFANGLEVPALRWADVSGGEHGFALLNESKYGHDALGPRLRINLVRSAYEPDMASDLGRQQFAYSFLPHAGDWRAAGIPRCAAEFNQPLLVAAGAGGEILEGRFSPVLSGAPGILLGAIKLARSGDARVLRLYDSTGQGGAVSLAGLPAGAAVWEANVLEDPRQQLALDDGALPMRFTPWQIRTLLVS